MTVSDTQDEGEFCLIPFHAFEDENADLEGDLRAAFEDDIDDSSSLVLDSIWDQVRSDHSLLFPSEVTDEDADGEELFCPISTSDTPVPSPAFITGESNTTMESDALPAPIFSDDTTLVDHVALRAESPYQQPRRVSMVCSAPFGPGMVTPEYKKQTFYPTPPVPSLLSAFRMPNMGNSQLAEAQEVMAGLAIPMAQWPQWDLPCAANPLLMSNSSMPSQASENKKLSKNEAFSGGIIPNHVDVLSGQGVSRNHHNRFFLDVCKEFAEEYASTKQRGVDGKKGIALRIISMVKSANGRFLKQQDDDSKEWCELTTEEAINKVCHCLRDISRKKTTGRKKVAASRILNSQNSV